MSGDKLSVFIQQPYFLPWLGFFAKLAVTDIYAPLENAKHRRNHISRVLILGSDGQPIWVKIPVGASQNDFINEIHMPKDGSYFRKILSTIKNSYGKAAHFHGEFPFIEGLLIEELVFSSSDSLGNVNIKLVKKLVDYLEIQMPVILESSALATARQDRTKRKLEVIQAVGADTLIIGDGSSQHIHDFEVVKNSGVAIKCLKYYTNHPKYTQVQRKRNKLPFYKGLSIVDSLLNIGKEKTKKIILDVKLSDFHKDGCVRNV